MTVRARYTHYRIPNYPGFTYPKRGKPNTHDATQYSRNIGWIDTDINVPPLERGGTTVCELVDEHDTVLNIGVAVCSYADNFNYKLGRTIASGRAIAQIHAKAQQ